MYTLKAKENFYDKEHPGRLIQIGEPLTTADKARVQNLLNLGWAEVVSEPQEKSVEETEGGLTIAGAVYGLNEVKQALNAIGVKTAANAGRHNVCKKVKVLSAAQMAELITKLSE